MTELVHRLQICGRITIDLRDHAKCTAQSDEDIQLDDLSEVDDWQGATRGRFYKPVKKAISIRLDADVIEYFRSRGGRYQSQINEVLRHYMLDHLTDAQ